MQDCADGGGRRLQVDASTAQVAAEQKYDDAEEKYWRERNAKETREAAISKAILEGGTLPPSLVEQDVGGRTYSAT